MFLLNTLSDKQDLVCIYLAACLEDKTARKTL